MIQSLNTNHTGGDTMQQRTRESLIAWLQAEIAWMDWGDRAERIAEEELVADGWTVIRDKDEPHGEARRFHADHLRGYYEDAHPEDPEPPLPSRGDFGWTIDDLEPEDYRALLEIVGGRS